MLLGHVRICSSIPAMFVIKTLSASSNFLVTPFSATAGGAEGGAVQSTLSQGSSKLRRREVPWSIIFMSDSMPSPEANFAGDFPVSWTPCWQAVPEEGDLPVLPRISCPRGRAAPRRQAPTTSRQTQCRGWCCSAYLATQPGYVQTTGALVDHAVVKRRRRGGHGLAWGR